MGSCSLAVMWGPNLFGLFGPGPERLGWAAFKIGRQVCYLLASARVDHSDEAKAAGRGILHGSMLPVGTVWDVLPLGADRRMHCKFRLLGTLTYPTSLQTRDHGGGPHGAANPAPRRRKVPFGECPGPAMGTGRPEVNQERQPTRRIRGR
jgi:hypothetical protein